MCYKGWQGVTRCCRVLQGVVGCCKVGRVLQGVVGCCKVGRVLQGVVGCCKVLLDVTCCSAVSVKGRENGFQGVARCCIICFV